MYSYNFINTIYAKFLACSVANLFISEDKWWKVIEQECKLSYQVSYIFAFTLYIVYAQEEEMVKVTDCIDFILLFLQK